MRIDDDDALLELAKYLSVCGSTSRVAARATFNNATFTPSAVAKPPPPSSKPPQFALKGPTIWDEEPNVDVGHDVVANLYMMNMFSHSRFECDCIELRSTSGLRNVGHL